MAIPGAADRASIQGRAADGNKRGSTITGTIDKSGPDAERAERRVHWRQRAASWKLRSSAADRARDARLSGLLIAAAGIGPDAAVLDLGAGSGEPAIAAALAVGAAGLVVALDHAPEMLHGARERAAAPALGQLHCVVADMAELPFGDGAFDAAVARFSLMSVTDRPAALRAARRGLRPGGRAAFLVWGPEAANDRLRALRAGMTAFFGADAVEAATSGARPGLGEAGALTALLRDAGFTAIEERAVEDCVEIPADRRAWSARMERTYGDLVGGLTAARRTALDAALRDAFAPYRDGELYRLRAEIRLGIGTAPVAAGA